MMAAESPSMTGDRFLTQAEVANMLGISTRVLERQRVSGGGIFFVKIGRCVRYRQSDIHAWIEQNRHPHTSHYEKAAG